MTRSSLQYLFKKEHCGETWSEKVEGDGRKNATSSWKKYKMCVTWGQTVILFGLRRSVKCPNADRSKIEDHRFSLLLSWDIIPTMSSFAPFDYSSLNCPSQQMLSPPAVPDPSPPPTYSQVEHAVQSIIWQKETSDGSLAPAYESYPYASAVSSPSSDGGAAFPAVAPSTSGSFAHSPHVTAGDLVGSLSHSPSGLSSSVSVFYISPGGKRLGLMPSGASQDANSQQGSVAAGLPTAAENVKPFISKLWALLNDPDHYRDCLVWE